MAKNGVSKGLQDILLQGLGTETQSSVSSRREERQQLREEKREDRQAEGEARKKGDDESTVTPSSGGDEIGGIGGGPIILNLVTSGTDLNEVLTGTDEVDSLYGAGGNDIVIGRGNPTGAESLYGGTGNDVIFGNSHVDSAYGGDGNDLVEGNHGNDFLQGDDGNDTLLDGPTTGSADQLVSVSGGDADENSDSHSDKIAWAGALGDGSGYVTGWGAGIGALVAPPQALKIQKFNNFGQPVGTPVRIDEFFSATENAGPFELKNDIRVLGLMGSDADKFVVVFESEFQDQSQGNSAHAYMMVFNNNDLSTDLAQFQFSESTDRTQRAPTAVALSNGDLIVAWQEQHRDEGDINDVNAGIYFRKYNIADSGNVTAVDGLASTTVVGSSGNDYRVNITTDGDQVSPEMAILDNGNVLVAWNSNGNTGEVGDFGVYFRIVNYSGGTPTAVTGEIRVNQTIAGNQEISAKNIAVLSNGNVVVTWNGNGPGDTQGTFFRIFDQNGVAVTNETLVNQTTFREDIEATVTELPDGGFLVVWTRDVNDTPGNPGPGLDTQNYDIFARQFDAAGVAVTNEFQVNTVGDPAFLEDQRRPHVTTLPNGLVVITWDSGRDPQINGPGYSSRDEEVMQQVFVFSPSTGGDDTMNGGSGLDFVFGQSGNDSLLGGNGDFVDSLSGGSGRDVLHGDSGADALFGGFGGGGGNTDALAGDVVHYVDSNAAVNVNLNDNLTETGGHAQGDFITGVEHILGSANNDSLTGIGTLQSGQETFALNNSIVGGLGTDAIFGLDGNDSLFGDFLPAISEPGSTDSLFGGSGNDLMYGGDGGDSMFGDAGADTMFGDTSDDTMTGGAGADTLNGGTHGLGDFASYLTSSAGVNVDLGDGVTETGGDAAGDSIVGIEHVYGSSFADRLAGDLSRNSLIGQAGDDTIFGADGNDFLIGDLIAGGVSGSDSLFGGTGIDQLDGMDGNDTLHGGAGSGLNGDALGGGSGNDWASYLDATVGVTADLSTNTGTGGDATGDTYSAIENLIGGDGGDTLTGDGGANSLLGMGGNDTLTGGLGADVLNGGAHGTGDWANYVNSNAAVIVNLQDGLAESGGHAQGDSLFDIEHIFGSTTGNDTLTGNLNGNSLVGHSGLDQLFGNDGADALFGEANNDTLTGGADADSLFGGGNADVASYEGSHLGVYVNLTDAAPESQGHAEGDVLDSIESLIGSDQNDTLITVSGAEENAISGGLGNDTMDGRDGADSMNGGAGSDWAYYNDSGAAVTVDLTDANLETGGMAQGDFLTLIENLLGSSFNDILIAGVGVNILDGAAGDDLLDGGADADTMIGGAGTDTADYVKSNAGVTVDLSDDETEVGGHAQGDSLTGIENLIGSILDDHLIGDDNVNTIVALGDDDTVEGGDAADSLFGGSGFDWVDYSNSDWAVTVTLGSTDAQTGEIDGDQIGDVLSGFEAVRGSNQNDQGDTLTSVLSSAILDGQLGDDFFIAGAGADSFIGGFGSDTVDYRLSGTAVNVNLATGVGSGGLAAGDLYTDVENVLGSNFNDILVGLAGSNTLAGFDGDDSLFGGSSTDSLIGDIGDDFIQGGSGGDSIVGGAGSNDFAVYTNDVSQTEGVTVDLSTGTGTGGDASDDTPDSEGNPQSIGETLFGIEHVIGSGNNDSINGDDGVNWLFGASGIDALRGGGGNDSLFGGDGNDLLGGFAPGAVDTGADSLFGGTGNDSLFYDPNDTALVGGIGNDLLIGRSGFDSVQLDAARWNFNGGFADIETFDLGDGNDVFLNTSSVTDLVNIGQGLNVFGGSGRDQISMRGAAGAFSGMDDNLDGGAGNDIIWGGFGHDGISGGEGDDQLYGGKGDEKFFGNQGFDVFYVGQAEGTDLIFDEATEVNGLVLFWGWDSTFPPVGSGADVFDGVDPSEIMIDYAGNQVTITFTERGGTVTFERVDNGDGTWDSTVDILNLWDYGNGDAGNSSTVPPTFARDVWSATFDASTGEFTAFTLAVNG